MSAVSFASPLNPVTSQGEWASPFLGYGDDVHEDAQTGRQSDYLFDPPPQKVTVPGLMLVESAQTREDAADALFEPPLERSGGSAGIFIPKVKLCHASLPMNHPQNVNVGVSRTTNQSQRGRVQG
jgi:hypothetical protein